MNISKAIITAAGFGSRFLPITKSFPKEMLPIIDKPIIHHLVDECAAAGVAEVIIVASPAEVEKFEDYFFGRAINIRTLMIRQHKLERWSKVEKVFALPQITIVPQDETIPYGNGRPLLTVKDLLTHEEAFLVMFGDDLVVSETSAARQLVDFYQQNPCDALFAVQEVTADQVDRFGIVEPEGETNVVRSIMEKPETGKAPSNLASYGRY
ncbi:NTP transferase domain-containing protein, partial [Candidatus Dojkabacteria bacterium]|nr:NTP transferase domain-containing protein [Candidatus Dojkabacteria bacterium]